MGDRARHSWTFIAGALLGGAVAVWAYLAWFTPASPLLPRTRAALPVPTAAAPLEPQPPASVQAVAATGPAPTLCAFDPLLARSSERDGQFALDAALALNRSADPSPFLAVADEAAREGRARDAEVALLVACRIAGRAGVASAPAADVQSRLAHHYTNVAASGADAPARTQLLERAEALLGSSVEVYATTLGKQASRTRMAQERLAALRDPPPRALTVAVPERRVEPLVPESTSRMGSSRLSLADRPPTRDEAVSDLDGDIQRLYAQAQAVSRDPAGLQRRHQYALTQRAACDGDAECLRGWYSLRKRQLFAEFSRR